MIGISGRLVKGQDWRRVGECCMETKELERKVIADDMYVESTWPWRTVAEAFS